MPLLTPLLRPTIKEGGKMSLIPELSDLLHYQSSKPKDRPRLVILDAQSEPNYEVVIPNTGGVVVALNDRRCSGDCI